MAGPGRRTAALAFVVVFFLGRPWSAWAQADLEQSLAHVEALLRRGGLKSPEVELGNLARLHPESFAVRNNLGALYMQQRRYPEACRELHAAVDLTPEIARGPRNRGRWLVLTEAVQSAILPLRRAKTLEPNDPRTRYQLGYA